MMTWTISRRFVGVVSFEFLQSSGRKELVAALNRCHDMQLEGQSVIENYFQIFEIT